LSFSWDTFGIERMIKDKIVCSDFLACNIYTDLPFGAQNFNLLGWKLLLLFKNK
jgi:hypothetical protein